MKLHKTIFIAVLSLPLLLLAQENTDSIIKKEVKLQRAAFESTALIETQTNVLYTKGTLEMVMNHRFGLVNGTNDMIGIWAPANIRIALNYSITDRIAIGYGTTKDSRLQDISLKGAILRQTRNNEMPFSLTYYGNAAMSALPKDNFLHPSDRFSYFNQLIFARRFNANLSFQIAPSFSHFNYVEGPMKSDMFAVALGGRIKISPSASILADYNQPVSKLANNPRPGVALGFEFSTGSHAFQIFVTNYKGIIAQQNNLFNQNNFFKNEFLIGFNITRLWHL